MAFASSAISSADDSPDFGMDSSKPENRDEIHIAFVVVTDRRDMAWHGGCRRVLAARDADHKKGARIFAASIKALADNLSSPLGFSGVTEKDSYLYGDQR